ncbi:MAG: response regulator [Pseudomonadota bacterium]
MSKKIFIIDDDPNIVRYLETLFQDNGYETCSASDGAEAMAVLKTEKPDLVTLDLEMPQEWGPHFFRRLSKDPEHKDLPVIVISGVSRPELAIKKVVAVIKKPFDREELLSVIKKTIG